ncbi:hypothetical protein [Deefgea piscis]|uniref:hypothetical protein n=1 Tax=Deefgea piscis TaxID=2739061 RepID=UPI001C825B1E|nr:hypothetical protein [Deefgea piscis]QZA80786.1 hypothetical protein K4H25_15025 [Deefgea piscis]
MLTGLGIVTVVLLATLFWYYVIYNPAAQTDWERLPTLAQYRQQHPQCVRGEQTLCCHCGSTEHLDLGLLQYTDWRRQMMCRQCKNRLWRESD